ncbi:MAG TPA: hypothetical protein PK542_08175 [Treponemataceae bacterium]|nr:hypothetical protein [Treponemataceae bacterium]
MRKASRNAAAWALSLAVASSCLFGVRFSMLEKSPHPTGLDGYYYALQAKSLVEEGHLENPDSSPGFYLCGLFAIICGDAIIGCKVYAAVISVALAVSIFLAILAMFPGRYPNAALGFFLCAASPSCAQLAVNYINNLTGLAFLFAYVSCFFFAWRRRDKPSVPPIAAALVFFALACLSHLITACFAIAFTAVFILLRLKSAARWVVAGTAFVAFLYIAIAQWQRLAGVFSAVPAFPAASVFFRTHLRFAIVLELSAYFAIAWIVGMSQCVKTKRLLPYAVVPLVLFFPFWKLDSLDMGYRMFLSAIPCSIILAVAFGTAYARPFSGKAARVAYAATLCCAALLCAFSPRVYDLARDPPYEYYKKVASRIELGKDTLLIAHLGLNHVYTYYNDFKMALNYVPDFAFPHEKIWRVAYGVPVSAITARFPELAGDTLDAEVRRIDSRYILIREDLWKEYLKREDPEVVRALLNWYNPHTVRPSFIR